MWKADVQGEEIGFAGDKERKHGAACGNSTCPTKVSRMLPIKRFAAETGTPTSQFSPTASANLS